MNALNWIRTVQERVQRDDPVDSGSWFLWWLRWLRRSKLGKRFGLSRANATQEAGLLAPLKDGQPKAPGAAAANMGP